MPAGSAAALICDAAALIDYLVERAPDYRLFRKAIDQARSRDVPRLVLAEVDYFLRDESQRPGQVLKFTVHASAARSRIRREE